MKHYPSLFLLFLFAVGLFCSCDDEETYADRREKENQQIQNFLNTGVNLTDTNSDTYSVNVPGGINVISESDFAAKGYTTDASRNEYVLFNSSGVYMQILRKGPGKPLAEGESATVLVRYTEYDIASAYVRSTNVLNAYAVMPDLLHLLRHHSGLLPQRRDEKHLQHLHRPCRLAHTSEIRQPRSTGQRE